MSLLSLQFEPRQGSRQRLRVSGRLDRGTRGLLEEALAPMLVGTLGPTTLELDLAGLESISLDGVRAILRARRALAPRHRHLMVTRARPGVRKVFQVLQAVPVAEVFASHEELDAYLDAVQRKAEAAAA